MNSKDYRDLENNLSDNLIQKLSGLNQAVGEKHSDLIKASVAEEFRKMTDEEKILSLSPDEVKLLIKFREWSRSPSSASGVFHWRKQYGK